MCLTKQGIGRGIVAAFLAAIGICFLVSGFTNHLNYGSSLAFNRRILAIFLRYFVGFLFFGAAKVCVKYKKEE